MDLSTIWEVLTSVVFIASVITQLTPTPKDDEIVGKLYKWLIEYPAIVGNRTKETGQK